MLPSAMAMIMGAVSPQDVTPVYLGGGKRRNGDSAILTFPETAEPGDLVVAGVRSTATITGGAGGWLYSTPVGNGKAAVKRLEIDDLLNVVQCAATPWVFGVYREPRSTIQRTSGSIAGTGPTLAGFEKSFFCVGLVGLGWSSGGTAEPIFPAPWTQRQTVSSPDSNNTPFALYDLLDPSDYVDDATIHMGGSSSGTTYGVVHELLI